MKYVKDQGVWKPIIQYSYVNGSWERVKDTSAKVNGVWRSTLPPIGTFIEGGYVAGVIDTLDSGGERYIVLVAPKAFQVSKQWSVYGTGYGAAATSKWDGLTNSNTLVDEHAEMYPAAKYCLSLTANGYSDWYLPAVDELELAYRNLKPNNLINDVAASDNYPGQVNGYNPNSDPVGPGYVNTQIVGNEHYDRRAYLIQGSPMQTTVEIFKENASESFWPPNFLPCTNCPSYWTSTHYSSRVALHIFFTSADCGNVYSKSGRQRTDGYAWKADLRPVRPVRRLLI